MSDDVIISVEHLSKRYRLGQIGATTLRESAERMTLAAEAAKFGVWGWNIALNQVWGSERWLRLFGFEAGEDISFEKVIQRIHPDDPATPNHVQGIVARPTNPPLHGDTGLAAVFRTFAAIQYDGWKTALNKLLTSEAAGKSIAL